jgi:hypothetical protein
MDIIAEGEILGLLAYQNEGNRLYNLACHSLFVFLRVSNNRKRLKRCPYCKIFFIAKDMKRKICYSNECFTEYKRLEKQKQRKNDPVKYI